MELWMPGADRSQTFNLNGGSMIGGPARGVLHTTETLSIPSYVQASGTPDAPHFTVHPTLTIRQHYPINVACRALRNASGGVQTNRQGDFCVQIEAVGFAKWDIWPDAEIEKLYQVMAWVNSQTGIPLDIPVDVGDGEEYGLKNHTEMSNAEWLAFNAWCTHQNVPENTHWDTGDGLYKYIKERIGMGFTPHEIEYLKSFVKELDDVGSNPTFIDEGNLIRDIRKDLITRDELNAALSQLPQATQDIVNKTLTVLVKGVK